MTNLSIGDDIFRIEVEGDATKPALVLSHALGANLGLWEAQMPALLEAFRVIRYDSRGHGGSRADGGPYSIARLGRDVLGIVDAFEIDTFHFLGVSMGGAVGQWLLVHAGHRIKRAVLANTTAKFSTPATWNTRIASVLEKGMTAIVDGTMERWFSPAFAERAPEKVAALRAVFENGSPEGYAGCCAALRDLDLREALHSIKTPVLVLSGRDDTSIGETATRHLVETIPDAKHVALDARHMSNVEADEAFSKAVVGFLTSKISTAKRQTGKAASPARPAKTATRRIGTRRSTAARLPLGAMVKQADTRSVAKPARGAAASPASRKDESRPEKAKGAKGKTPQVSAPKAKVIATKTIATEAAAPKLKSAQPKSAKLKPGKAPAKVAGRSASRASVATTKVSAPTKSVKRPSAKSLKAMAAASSKARTKASAPKTGTVAKVSFKAPTSKTGVKQGRAIAAKVAPRLETPTSKAGLKTTGAKTTGAKTTGAKTTGAKTTGAKTTGAKLTGAKTVAAKAAPSRSAPLKKPGAKIASRTKASTAPRAKNKPGRRVS